MGASTTARPEPNTVIAMGVPEYTPSFRAKELPSTTSVGLGIFPFNKYARSENGFSLSHM